ncbi:MAG TPA: hypothetical protein VFQ22_00290, partial [Longimicrobiales bacterium]|nr:hypothetical protein [Longimicrobiales bacterium]
APDFPVSGPYTGRLVVQDQIFEARLELRTGSDARVGGRFFVRAPFELEGEVEGVLVDDLFRISVAYHGAGRGSCDGRVTGILTVSERGRVLEGPVSVVDCQGSLPGRMDFRR